MRAGLRQSGRDPLSILIQRWRAGLISVRAYGARIVKDLLGLHSKGSAVNRFALALCSRCIGARSALTLFKLSPASWDAFQALRALLRPRAPEARGRHGCCPGNRAGHEAGVVELLSSPPRHSGCGHGHVTRPKAGRVLHGLIFFRRRGDGLRGRWGRAQGSVAVRLWFVLVVLLWFILAVRFWLILFIQLLGFCRWLGFCLIFCLILGSGSGCGADAVLPALIWFVFFCVWFCVWLAW